MIPNTQSYLVFCIHNVFSISLLLVVCYLISLREARMSMNRPSAQDVLDNLIYNYTPTYCGKSGSLSLSFLFILWCIIWEYKGIPFNCVFLGFGTVQARVWWGLHFQLSQNSRQFRWHVHIKSNVGIKERIKQNMGRPLS